LKVNIPKGIFIAGTDTDVGKTVVTAALACCIKNSGNSVAAVKPFQTGTEEEGLLDIEFIYKVLGLPFEMNDVCPVRLSKPLFFWRVLLIVACGLKFRVRDVQQ